MSNFHKGNWVQHPVVGNTGVTESQGLVAQLMTDTSSCSLPDNTVYTSYFSANSSSEKTLLHHQPPEQVKAESVSWNIKLLFILVQ